MTRGLAKTAFGASARDRRLPPAIERLLRQVLDQHGELSRLCDSLEAIADELPRACPMRCRAAAATLETLLPAHHALESELLSALLGADQPELRDRIARQHGEDEGLAAEITHALEPLIGGRGAPEPETLGYMLRCFFTTYRRSMLVEELALRPAAAQARGYAASASAAS